VTWLQHDNLGKVIINRDSAIFIMTFKAYTRSSGKNCDADLLSNASSYSVGIAKSVN
jgi:hypothetical protein